MSTANKFDCASISEDSETSPRTPGRGHAMPPEDSLCNLSNTRSDLGLSSKGSALLTSDKYDSQLLVMEIRRHKRVRVASRLLSETAGSSAECAGGVGGRAFHWDRKWAAVGKGRSPRPRQLLLTASRLIFPLSLPKRARAPGSLPFAAGNVTSQNDLWRFQSRALAAKPSLLLLVFHAHSRMP